MKRGVERAGGTALVYASNSKECCSEAEVDEWLRRRRIGEEEERCLITDQKMSRGWEASHTLVLGQYPDWENLVMSTVGYCALLKSRSDV